MRFRTDRDSKKVKLIAGNVEDNKLLRDVYNQDKFLFFAPQKLIEGEQNILEGVFIIKEK